MIKTWPKDIYDIGAVIVAIRAVLDKSSPIPKNDVGSDTILVECLAELFVFSSSQLAFGLTITPGTPPTASLAKHCHTSSASGDQMSLSSFESIISSRMSRIRPFYSSTSTMNSWRNGSWRVKKWTRREARPSRFWWIIYIQYL
jgi:hypothetical protein